MKYICLKKKDYVTHSKAWKYCIIHKCPHLTLGYIPKKRTFKKQYKKFKFINRECDSK